MKKIEFAEQEIEILREIVAMAATNFEKVTPVAFEPSPAERSILCDIFSKLY